MITIAYITAPSEKGQELCEMAVPALEKVISEQLCEEIAWAIINHPDYPEYCGVNLPQRQLMAYNCFHSADLVIFDGSIDSEDSETPKTLRYKKSSSRGKSISIDNNVCFKIENMSDVFDISAMYGLLSKSMNGDEEALKKLKAALENMNAPIQPIPSIPEKGNSQVCSQYEYAFHPMIYHPHALIVSRTRLPYNLEGFRNDGAPSWLRSHVVSTTGEIKKETFMRTNKELVTWLVKAVSELELPRKNKWTPKTEEEVYKKIAEEGQLQKGEKEGANEGKKWKEERHDIFVSYLSKESRFRNNPAPIEDFLLQQASSILKEIEAREAKQTESKGTGASFIYAPPGDLSNEIMTEQRRWELVSQIERQMRKCKAVLIYMTDGYLRSWWTFAELMCLSYRFYSSKTGVSEATEVSNGWNPTIYVVRQNSVYKLETLEEMKSFLPEMTETQHTEIARKFSNSDPQLTCYELDEDVSLAELPDNVKEILADLNLEFIKENYSFIENSSNYPKEKIIESYNSYAQSKAFREKLIVECNECCQQSDYTVDDFINLRYSYRLDKTVLGEKTGEKINKKGVITLPCGHSIKVKEGETYYRFLQPRCCGHALNKEGWIVKPIRPVEVADVAEVLEVAE